MRAAVLTDIARLEIREVERAGVAPGAVLLRVEACGVCGSDLRLFRHGHPRVRLPQILGHEISGSVAELGAGVDAFGVGDRVVVTPRVSCGDCPECRRGHYPYCPNGKSFGYQIPGGFAEYVLVPAEGMSMGVLNRMTSDVSFDEAALTEPLACCLRAQRALGIKADDTVVILGGGHIGLIHTRLAKIHCAGRVILVEPDPARAESQPCRASGADFVLTELGEALVGRIRALSDGHGADVVIVAVSSAEAQQLAVQVAARGARINFFGGLPEDAPPVVVPSRRIHYDEIHLTGSHGSSPEDNRLAASWLAERRLRLGDLITHIVPLEQIGEAFANWEQHRGIKSVVHPHDR